MTIVKYILRDNESFAHKFTKIQICAGLISGEIRTFCADLNGKQYNVMGNCFKTEYPFLDKPRLQECKNCNDSKCEKCYYIPNTRIRFISDIAILDNTGKVIQVIEVKYKHELTTKKLEFYRSQSIQVIIIDALEFLGLKHLYSNLRVSKILECNS